jgi:hypothetical protein
MTYKSKTEVSLLSKSTFQNMKNYHKLRGLSHNDKKGSSPRRHKYP